MVLTVNTNNAALNTQRNLAKSSSALSTSLQRLSTGSRINSAKDDAAGLQISNRLTSQINGTNVAIKNASDGFSIAQTAEGALEQSTEILQRIRVLALQSANGSNSPEERKALNAEVTSLKGEIDRIANTTTFGGKKLLDGSFNNTAFQVGTGANETINMSIGDMSTKNLTKSIPKSFTVEVERTQFQGYTIKGKLIPDRWVQGDATTPSTGTILYNELNISIEGKDFTLPIHLLQHYVAPNGTDPIPLDYIKTLSMDPEINPAWKPEIEMLVISINNSNLGVQASLNETTKSIQISSEKYDTRLISIENTFGEIVSEKQTLYNVSPSVLDVSTQDNAQLSILTVDRALQAIDSQRAHLGAIQNRFENTIANLQNINENVSAARSRIQDTDFAAETARLSKNQIMQQAGTAILAQANQLPQAVLSLLK